MMGAGRKQSKTLKTIERLCLTEEGASWQMVPLKADFGPEASLKMIPKGCFVMFGLNEIDQK